jgi:hypothetical protein
MKVCRHICVNKIILCIIYYFLLDHMTKAEHFIFSRASGSNTKKVDWDGLEKIVILFYVHI